MHNGPLSRPRLRFSDAYPLRALTLTLAQLTGRRTLLRFDSGFLDLDNPIHTLGGARRAAKVRGKAPRHDA